jgi:hypothetical protein
MRGVMKQVYNGSHQHVCRPSASPREARLKGCKRDVGETMECGDALREPSERRGLWQGSTSRSFMVKG